MSENKTDPLLPCPFCGPGQSMVDPWLDDVSKRWAIGCGRCGASSGRSVHAEGSREAAIKSWNTRGLAAPQPAADRDDLVDMLWTWFEDRGHDLREERTYGITSEEFRIMLDEHEANLLPDGHTHPQPALGGREALARMIRKALVENWRDDYDGRQWDEDVLLTGCRKVGGGIGYQKPEEAAQRLTLDAADAILAAIPPNDGCQQEAVAWIVLSTDADQVRIWWRDKERATVWATQHNRPLIPLYAKPFATADFLPLAIPQERGVERAGEAGTYDDDGITHASTYDEGITYAIMQLAELTGSKDWQIRDGSEDHATDVQDTIMDVLKCAGLYDDETGKLATIAPTTANVAAGTDRAAIIEECANASEKIAKAFRTAYGADTSLSSAVNLVTFAIRALAGKETGR